MNQPHHCRLSTASIGQSNIKHQPFLFEYRYDVNFAQIVGSAHGHGHTHTLPQTSIMASTVVTNSVSTLSTAATDENNSSFNSSIIRGKNENVPQHLPPEIRGLLGQHGDSLSWLNEVAKFPNGVPRFNNKEECVTFMKEYNAQHGGSNPQFPHLQHIFTLIVGWDQIASLLFPAIEKARLEQQQMPSNSLADIPSVAADSPKKNIYEQPECAPVVDAIEERLNVSFHRCTTVNSTLNTFKYLYHHMKFGIFIKIQNSQLRIFAPFVNIDYQNTWSQYLTIDGDGTLDTYYSQKAGLCREEQIEYDKTKWWANGNIIWYVCFFVILASTICYRQLH